MRDDRGNVTENRPLSQGTYLIPLSPVFLEPLPVYIRNQNIQPPGEQKCVSIDVLYFASRLYSFRQMGNAGFRIAGRAQTMPAAPHQCSNHLTGPDRKRAAVNETILRAEIPDHLQKIYILTALI